MINLGMMYRLGLGVEPDPEIAYGWFNLAREGRSSVGQQYMSELITNFEVRSNRVSVIRRTFTTIANMPALPTEP